MRRLREIRTRGEAMTIRQKIDERRVGGALQRRARMGWVMATTQLLFGLVASVLIPVVPTGYVTLRMIRHGDIGELWWPTYAVTAGVLIPVMYIMEWLARGGTLVSQLNDAEASAEGWGSSLWTQPVGRWNAAAWDLEWELVLFAPRMVFEGLRRMRLARLVGGRVHERAAEMLQGMLAGEHGVEVDSLRREGEDEVGFVKAVTYLILYEWVGVSDDGTKVWVLTETREELGLAC